MAEVRSIVDDYRVANIGKRVDIILRNYARFNNLVDGYEKCLSIVIRNEREHRRRRENGELGVRIQTSNISDVTARTAVENVSIQEAIHEGDYDTALRGSENYFKHRAEIMTLLDMRDDYQIVCSQVESLDDDERKMLEKYIVNRRSFFTIADDENLSPEAVRSRIKRYKKIVKDGAVLFMTDKYFNDDVEKDLEKELELGACA